MFIYILVLTIVASATMIIPAASGMTILLVFGMYAPLMGVFDEILKGLMELNFNPIFDNNKNRLLTSMFLLVIFGLFQFAMLKELLPMNIALSAVIIFAMLYFALDTILRIRSTVLDLEVKSMPFAPALLIAMFIVFFFQNNINNLLNTII